LTPPSSACRAAAANQALISDEAGWGSGQTVRINGAMF
jgi:hypothetical protein